MRRARKGFLTKGRVVVLFVATLTLCSAGVASAAISDCIDATCRITTPDGSRGTGCVFEISQGCVFVLTAAHVVGNSSTVQCEFWRDGHQSQPIPAQVTARVSDDLCDAAVISLDQAQFGGVLPRAVPVASPDCVLGPGETVTSVGCANGAWSTGWKGHVLGYEGVDMHFVPTPANGRSGSAIFDANGERIVGLLRARTGNNSEGIATSVQSLYQAMGGKASGLSPRNSKDSGRQNGQSASDLSAADCPGGSCPAPTPYILPYRYREQFRNQPQSQPQQQQQVWPTLPQSSSVDLGATNQKLDKLIESQGKITDLLIEIRKPADPARPAPIIQAPAAPAETLKQAADEERTNILRSLVDSLVGDQGTLLERIQARRDKVKADLGGNANEIDIAKAYIRDFAQEKLSDGTLGLTGGKILGGALGLSGPLALAMGGGLWLLSRRIGDKVAAGEPLLVQTLFDRLGDKLEALKAHIAANQPPKSP
jgi:hypothetical protein